jgi:hypothetical protein
MSIVSDMTDVTWDIDHNDEYHRRVSMGYTTVHHMRAGENVVNTYTYPVPLEPISPERQVYHPNRSMEYEWGGEVSDPYPDELRSEYSPMSLDIGDRGGHPMNGNGTYHTRNVTGSQRVAAQVWMSAINMMMRDTGSVSDTSSSEAEQSRTCTSTPSSDLPEQATSLVHTTETQTTNTNETPNILGRTIRTHTSPTNNNDDLHTQTSKNEDKRTQRRLTTYFATNTSTDKQRKGRKGDLYTSTSPGAGVGPDDGSHSMPRAEVGPADYDGKKRSTISDPSPHATNTRTRNSSAATDDHTSPADNPPATDGNQNTRVDLHGTIRNHRNRRSRRIANLRRDNNNTNAAPQPTAQSTSRGVGATRSSNTRVGNRNNTTIDLTSVEDSSDGSSRTVPDGFTRPAFYDLTHSDSSTSTGTSSSGSTTSDFETSTGTSSSGTTVTAVTDNTNMNLNPLRHNDHRSAGGAEEQDTGHTFHTGPSAIPKSWILLDSCSTVNVFSNGELLENIRVTKNKMKISCQAGTSETKMIGDLPGFGAPVWHTPHGIANVLSLSAVRMMYKVRYIMNAKVPYFAVYTNNKMLKFVESKGGLYYYDTLQNDGKPVGHTMVSTVKQQREGYTNREYHAAKLARQIQEAAGAQSLTSFLYAVDNNVFRNLPITRRDVINAETIFGPSIASLKGRTVRHKPDAVPTPHFTIPPEILRRHQTITLASDIFTIDRCLFLMTKSRSIKFTTVQPTVKQDTEVLYQLLLQVFSVYRNGGFRVRHFFGDNQFEPLRERLRAVGVELNTPAASEHVPDAEREIRTLKEHVRGVIANTPYTRFPPKMVVECVVGCTMWKNSFPPRDGVHKTLSPRTLVTGRSMAFGPMMTLPFGAYAQVTMEGDNTMRSRTVGGVALRPTGNIQGGVRFMALATGRVISARRWEVLPVTDEVIRRVHQLARRAKASVRMGLDVGDDEAAVDGAEVQPVYEHEEEGVDVDEDEDLSDGDSTYYDASEGGDDLSDDGSAVIDSDGGPESDRGSKPGTEEDAEVVNGGRSNVNDIVGGGDADHEDPSLDPDTELSDEEDSVATDTPNTLDEPLVDDRGRKVRVFYSEGDGEEGAGDALDDPTRNQPQRYNLRKRSTLRSVRDGWEAKVKDTDGMKIALTQVSMKRGLQMFGDRGVAAVESEMRQLHDMGALEPVRKLTREEKNAALGYLMYLKEKSDGRIKGRGCADGRKQREYITKSEAASPTVSVEAVFITSVIDALEMRDVGVADIPGAYLHADADENILVRFDGTMAELLVKINPKIYKPYIESSRKGTTVLYAKLKKALYGCLRSGLLFWKNLSSYLQRQGFVLNPYDTCVANKVIGGHQCTIIWHVDDLKISHVSSTVVTNVLRTLQDKYGDLKITRGKVHEYLGMKLDFNKKGSVKIIMDDYVRKFLEESDPRHKGLAITPANQNLFSIDENSQPISESDAQAYHTATAKLLFLAKRARPDLLTAVAFLTTRVKSPTQEDYDKLGRVVKYLRGTPTLHLTLEANTNKKMTWRADGSHAVHPDMRGHTGGTFTLGRGSIYSTSTRQKINTKSSTETELVAADEVLTQAVWTKYFIEAQDNKPKKIMLLQDNMSAILLEKNGMLSSGKRTRHLSIRAFWVADQVKKGVVEIEHEPTEDMIADYFTKPLQGSAFRKLRKLILNEEH